MEIFISQPMKDKTNDEIIKERERAEKNIKEKYPNEEIEIIDSFLRTHRTTLNHYGFRQVIRIIIKC